MKKFMKIAGLCLSFFFVTSCLTTVEMTRSGRYIPIKRDIIKWAYHNDGYAHCYVNGYVAPKHRCAAIPRPPKRNKHVVRWVYHNDGYAHCYEGRQVVKKSRCSHLSRPPHIEWVYHKDGYAHCYVGAKLSKKTACSSIPRPPHKKSYS